MTTTQIQISQKMIHPTFGHDFFAHKLAKVRVFSEGSPKVWKTVKLGFVAAAAALGVVPDASAQDANDIEVNGEALYRENCAICHGENGEGNGSLAPQLSPPPTGLYQEFIPF